ncbi:MAG: acyl-CoA thioesterase [Rhodospirillaceae bacterium]|jgi:acyl-CoA thioesterase YciA|nr:acyl-CoA thioesterase [Rhodospirillaceae bacterium]MBT4589035.1 acyl-CoA thioesterase [Rhodospirillaceae bacterium]MBT7955307.1 acyl-CoA thioesterase [Rhodospirillaceae bacterium]
MADEAIEDAAEKPEGDRTITVVAQPADTNPSGDIFGGWILSQMDIAGGVAASRRAEGRTVTIGVLEMEFHKPVRVGDLVSCYTQVQKIGTTSIAIKIEAWTTNHYHPSPLKKVTEGVFTYVAIDENRKPRVIPNN